MVITIGDQRIPLVRKVYVYSNCVYVIYHSGTVERVVYDGDEERFMAEPEMIAVSKDNEFIYELLSEFFDENEAFVVEVSRGKII